MEPYQILRDIRHCLLGGFCHSGAITIAGGCLKVTKLDLAPRNPPQLVQLDALPQIVLQLLHRMSWLRSPSWPRLNLMAMALEPGQGSGQTRSSSLDDYPVCCAADAGHVQTKQVTAIIITAAICSLMVQSPIMDLFVVVSKPTILDQNAEALSRQTFRGLLQWPSDTRCRTQPGSCLGNQQTPTECTTRCHRALRAARAARCPE